jgi:NAD(P)-dependent dehydrogenase (short-subunit alcohol dehydrogenase family)
MNDQPLKKNEKLIHGYDLVIIGASGGIGQHLINVYKDTNTIFGTFFRHDSSDLIKGPNYYQVDVTDSSSINSFINELNDKVKKPVVIYTSGVSPNNLVHKLNEEDLNKTIATNLTGAMLITSGILPLMRDLKFGRFIYLSSILSRMAVQGTAGYTVTKAGLNAFAKVVALENAKKGITANSIALGYFDVGIISAVPPEYLKNNVLPNIPQGKLGDPDDIVNIIEFIIKTNYLTGATIDLNGGVISH